MKVTFSCMYLENEIPYINTTTTQNWISQSFIIFFLTVLSLERIHCDLNDIKCGASSEHAIYSLCPNTVELTRLVCKERDTAITKMAPPPPPPHQLSK